MKFRDDLGAVAQFAAPVGRYSLELMAQVGR